jgi:Meiotically up-regulated gene 113
MGLAVLALVVVAVALLWRVSEAQRSATAAEAELARTRADLQSARVQVERARHREEQAAALERDLGSARDRLASVQQEFAEVQAALATADRLLEEREPIIYPRRFPEETSSQLKERMDAIRARQQEIRRKGQVVIRFGLAVQDRLSAEELAKLKSLVRLARLALEGAADTLLDQVKATNQERLEAKFGALTTDLNRILKPWDLEIGRNYQATVRESLELMAEYQQQVETEREEQRALREQMREEAAALREAERAQREAEAEERKAIRDLQKAQEAANRATLEERDRWMARVAELEASLALAHSAKERAVAMAQLTKSGHVYIISNVGSFGPDVFKVGMTRRLDPEDRIAELGDASVPFPFDIHGMIRCDDAPGMEYALHCALEEQRVNLVNERKEFFRVSFAALRAEVEKQGCFVQLSEMAEATEYRQSEAKRRGLLPPSVTAQGEVGAEEPSEVGADDDES